MKDSGTILSEVKSDPSLEKMIQDSKEDYTKGNTSTTAELIDFLRNKKHQPKD
ncbi:hypothetical protein ACK1LH_19740 [Metabacillus indicus]|uniref:hypothetical protein n=1 Tax=Metabacillus indicus TaxID=246786 RepID=UPI0039845C85